MLYYGHNFFEELRHGTLPKFSNLSHFLWHNKSAWIALLLWTCCLVKQRLPLGPCSPLSLCLFNLCLCRLSERLVFIFLLFHMYKLCPIYALGPFYKIIYVYWGVTILVYWHCFLSLSLQGSNPKQDFKKGFFFFFANLLWHFFTY